ncbi:hypothetical protein C8R45DRAFT_1086430 [Mycena sanguinolenta]|nr:hypothetical protein C8R45DRAFT_1086430 [Mycena sanguinolenta]
MGLSELLISLNPACAAGKQVGETRGTDESSGYTSAASSVNAFNLSGGSAWDDNDDDTTWFNSLLGQSTAGEEFDPSVSGPSSLGTSSSTVSSGDLFSLGDTSTYASACALNVSFGAAPTNNVDISLPDTMGALPQFDSNGHDIVRPSPRAIHCGASFPTDRVVGGSPGAKAIFRPSAWFMAFGKKTGESQGVPAQQGTPEPASIFGMVRQEPVPPQTPSTAKGSGVPSAAVKALQDVLTDATPTAPRPRLHLPSAQPAAPQVATPPQMPLRANPAPPPSRQIPLRAVPAPPPPPSRQILQRENPPAPPASVPLPPPPIDQTPPWASPTAPPLPLSSQEHTPPLQTPLMVIESRLMVNAPKVNAQRGRGVAQGRGKRGSTRGGARGSARGGARGGAAGHSNGNSPTAAQVETEENTPLSPPPPQPGVVAPLTGDVAVAESARVRAVEHELRTAQRKGLEVSKQMEADAAAEQKRLAALRHNPVGGADLVVVTRPKRAAKAAMHPDGTPILRVVPARQTRGEMAANRAKNGHDPNVTQQEKDKELLTKLSRKRKAAETPSTAKVPATK